MKTFFIGKLVAKPEQKEALISSFEMLKSQPGFVDQKVYQNTTNPNEIISVEVWEGPQDHENFVQSIPIEAMENWMGLLAEKPVGDSYHLVD